MVRFGMIPEGMVGDDVGEVRRSGHGRVGARSSDRNRSETDEWRGRLKPTQQF